MRRICRKVMAQPVFHKLNSAMPRLAQFTLYDLLMGHFPSPYFTSLQLQSVPRLVQLTLYGRLIIRTTSQLPFIGEYAYDFVVFRLEKPQVRSSGAYHIIDNFHPAHSNLLVYYISTQLRRRVILCNTVTTTRKSGQINRNR